MRRQARLSPLFERGIGAGVLKGFHDGELKGFHDGEVMGEVKGEVKMLREKIFRFAQRRQIVLTNEQAERVRSCEDRASLDRWLDNVLDATNGDEVFR